MRLCLLSEIPHQWSAAVGQWSAMNEKHRRGDWPDRNLEYFYYQTLVGAWPLPLERALVVMEKAAREAKQHTSWTRPNPAYDAALRDFVTGTLGDKQFIASLGRFVAPLVEPGHINSLAETLLKLTTPGVPDIYQGNELWDLSLVDPDNRRPVDFATRERLLAELQHLSVGQVWQRRQEGLPKLWLIQKTLNLRRRHPGLFGADSSYEPLCARGDKAEHAVAFVRGGRAITIVPRLVMRLANEWANTSLRLPEGGWLNELTGESFDSGERAVGELLRQFPVALLSRKGEV
jgi:(1->4)-alpha-D-glucan 1-alpha-D-glucosylmutase